MLTTVTTSTAAALNTSIAGSLSLIVTLGLIALLIKQELLTGLDAAWAARLRTALGVVIAPLLIVFAVSVVMRIALLLG
jgi:hypothetical protein